MKKGINVHPDYDNSGRWYLEIEKKRGKLTLEEIKEAAREHEWDYYLLVLDCFHDEHDVPYGYETPVGGQGGIIQNRFILSRRRTLRGNYVMKHWDVMVTTVPA